MTPTQEDEVSVNEENALDFSKATPNQENEKHVREIFFSEENSEKLLNTEETPLSAVSEPEQNEAVARLVSETELNVDAINVSVCSAASDETDGNADDFFCGWTQTTKTYSHFGLEGKEIDLTADNAEEDKNAAAEIADPEESEEQEDSSADFEIETVKQNEAEAAAQKTPPVLSEDGTLRRVLNRYERPSKGFGFGLLDEEDAAEDEPENLQAEETEVYAESENENVSAQEAEPEIARPEGLDSWGSLAFDLGLPVTLPEIAEKEELKAVGEAEKVKKQEKKGKKISSASVDRTENVKVSEPIDLDGDDFSSPENVFIENERRSEKAANDEKPEKDEKPERSRRSRRSRRGVKKENETVLELPEEIQTSEVIETEIPVKEPAQRRRSRRRNIQDASANDEKSAAIGGIVAGIVASKMTETEKNQTKAGRRRETEEKLTAQSDFCIEEEAPFSSNEFDEEEMNQLNGARSRRRRRNQREKLERNRKIQELPVCQIEEDEEERDEASAFSAKRFSRDERRIADSFETNRADYWQESMKIGLEIDEDEEDEEEILRPRRQRRSRRQAPQDSVSRFEERDFDDDEEPYSQDDEEAHVFTEVQDDEEEEDGEWETDFSQHDVPGWRYTIDFIVNTNLKARKREPSTMAGNIRMAKRSGKRK